MEPDKEELTPFGVPDPWMTIPPARPGEPPRGRAAAPAGAVAPGASSPQAPTEQDASLAAPACPTAELPLLDQSVRFHVLRLHAQGGLGQVLLAVDAELDREVALKEIQAALADNPHYQRRFLREARITGRLEHPGVVPVYGLGRRADGRPYYAMRFIRGQSLRQAIKQFHEQPQRGRGSGKRQLALRQLLARFVAVCNTMAYAHSKGVIHRDLKPDNIMLGEFGETLVVDWGLARATGVPENETLSGPELSAADLTRDGTPAGLPMGTVPYMSPEQAAGCLGEVGPASDIYSLGATLYHLLTGKVPIEGTRADSILYQIQTGEFPTPRQVDPDIPRALDAITRKAMALRPEDRYTSAQALADDIERYLADEPIRGGKEGLGPKLARLTRRHRAWAWAGVASLVLVTVASVLALLQVDAARQREKRLHDLRLLSRELEFSLKEPTWDAEHLARLDDLGARLRELDRDEGDRAGAAATNAFVRFLSNAIQTPDFDVKTQKRIQRGIALLAERAPELAREVQADFQRRLVQWEPLFDIAAPFGDLREFLDAGRLRVEGRQVLPISPPGAEPQSVILTRHASAGHVQMEAVFGPSWSTAHAVGLLLNVEKGQGYQFLVAIPEFAPGFDENKAYTLASLESARRAGDGIMLCIVRNHVVLRQVVTTLPPGPLHLKASRQGQRLEFEVNKMPPLVFEDPFALSSAHPGVFGLLWPPRVGLERLRATSQAQVVPPQPLEQADDGFLHKEYGRALAIYQAQAPLADQEALRLECGYKQALCLQELGRKDEAAQLLRQLADFPEGPAGPGRRWRVLAAYQLLLAALVAEQFPEAEALQARLMKAAAGPLAERVVSFELRNSLLELFRVRAARWLSALHARKNLPRLQRYLRIEELLNESPQDLRGARWQLLEAYRSIGRDGEALSVLRQLLAEPGLPLEERAIYLRELAWLGIESKVPDLALAEVDRLLAVSPDSPLLLDRARISLAQGRREAALKDVELFFERAMDRTRFDYVDWADACLLRGFLRQDAGDHNGALQAWRAGLARDWPGGLSGLPRGRLLSGLRLDRRMRAILCQALLASLTGDMTEAEANFLYTHVVAGNSTGSVLVFTVSKKVFPLPFIRSVLASVFQTQRGRECARQMAYRQISFSDYFVDPLKLIFTQALVLGAYPNGPAPAELEPLVWQTAETFFQAVSDDRVPPEMSQDLMVVWRGKNEPREAWNRVKNRMQPALRGSIGFCLGRRLLQVGQADAARALFEEVIALQPDNSLLALARDELARLGPK